MKYFLILASFFLMSTSFASDIQGEVSVKGKVPKGTLFIFAKKFDGSMPMPLAVKKIDSPNFPVKFSLGEANKMIPSLPFKGPFKIVARLSPSGGAMDKSGVEASTTKAVKIGDKNIKLVLKVKK